MRKPITADMVEVCFELDPEDWHGAATEWLWARIVPDRLPLQAVVMNFPFFARGVSHSDTVLLEPVVEGYRSWYRFAGVSSCGGNSTLILITPKDCPEFATRWRRLEKLGCQYEWISWPEDGAPMRLYSIVVPASTDIKLVLAIIGEGKKAGGWILLPANIEHKSNQESVGQSDR